MLLDISKTESNEFRILDLEAENFDLECFHKRSKEHRYYIDDTPEEFLYLATKKIKRILPYTRPIKRIRMKIIGKYSYNIIKKN